ncbi:glutathione S-transferase family protein [Janthinobacterium sp. 17J80-10]|uniref:glutathione S-transferase family protein n=1 Tax=Janthinobacterium sp. 17J80-10 TaxID=2497863 RepID=UPI00100534C6|nr:glutathione S-transferase family protein [Janthinobacterium sp. 17J80-10]QAU33037.1 glutathione S-transferase family protein [Janthinobacterium sp. 17J80-10]
MKLTLISHALCPYVQRAAIALKEKNIPFERIDIDLRKKPTWFLAMSPLGKTPVLKVDDQPIFESAVICEYLEDTAGPALHPEDPLTRARHRAWIEFASATLNNIWTFYVAKDAGAYSDAANALIQRFVQIEGVLQDGPYFGGKHFSLVDAAFAPVFRYFDVFDEASGITFFANTPKVRAWRRALSERPSVRGAVSTDYPALLRQFVTDQHGELARRFAVTA